MILVSACLSGTNCAWDGRNRLNQEVKKLVAAKLAPLEICQPFKGEAVFLTGLALSSPLFTKGWALPVCPEVLGGRGIPRTKAEIRGGSGEDVLDGRAKVFDENENDVTAEFLKGAHLVLEIAKKHNIKKAILKSKSPSCGVGMIYDGTFKSSLVRGDGVTAALLKREGISCQGI